MLPLAPVTDPRPHTDASTSLPALTATPRRRALYLVGEAERSSPKPAAAEGRTMISVNGRWNALRGRAVSYAQLLRIAFPNREGQDAGAATVSYRRPGLEGLSGLLTPGDAVPLTDGLLFNVNATYAS